MSPDNDGSPFIGVSIGGDDPIPDPIEALIAQTWVDHEEPETNEVENESGYTVFDKDGSVRHYTDDGDEVPDPSEPSEEVTTGPPVLLSTHPIEYLNAEGINLAVRPGMDLSTIPIGVYMMHMDDSQPDDHNDHVIEVLDTRYYGHYSGLCTTDRTILKQFGHDHTTCNYDALLAQLKEDYPGFTHVNGVSLLFFRVIN